MNKIRLSAILSLAALSLFAAPIVRAHANLVKSDPPANSAQKIPPTRVQLYFSEAPEPGFSAVSVLDRTGAAFDKRDLHLTPGNAFGLEISVNDLPLGLYTVAWQALSSVDGHLTKGSFVFTVGDTPLADSDPRQFISQVDAALEKSTLPPPLETSVRWLNILFLVALAGSFAFPLLILFPARETARNSSSIWNGYRNYFNAQTHSPDDALKAWARAWLKFTRAAWILFCFATLAMLIEQTLKTSDLSALPRVLTATRFGTLWLARAALLAGLGWILWKARVDWASDPRDNYPLLVGLNLCALLILNQSLNSHNAAVTNPPYVALVMDLLHLAGTAIWIGGLLHLLFSFPTFFRALPKREQPRQLAATIGTFSLVAFVVVGIIILSGAVSLIFQVGSVPAFFETLYGESLFVKFLLVLPLLALGALNLIVVRNAASVTARLEKFFARFRAAVATEVVLAVAIFLVVGVMTSIAPAVAAYEPSSTLILQTQRADDLRVTFAVSSDLVGTNDFDVKVVDATGAPVANAVVVRILSTHRDMDMGTQEYAATNQGRGHYSFRGGVFSMAGNWNLEILIRRRGLEDTRVSFGQPAFITRSSAPPRPLLIENTQALIGLGVTLLGFAIGTASILVIAKKRLRLVNLASAIVVSLVGLFVVGQVVANAPPPEIVVIPVAPPIARTFRSPVRGDPATLAAGKQIYQENCATCHGDTGIGNGPTAANLNPKPIDLTIHAPLHPEGELFWWVTNGISGTAMIAWESKLNDLQRWQVVQYVRTLGAAPPPANLAAQPATTPNALTPLNTDPAADLVRNEINFGDVRLLFVALPRASDISDFDVILQNASGQPISDAPRVNLFFAMNDMAHGTNFVDLAPIGEGRYRARGPWLFMGGKWNVGVIAQLKNGETYRATFAFTASEATGNVVSRLVESSPTTLQQINVSVYPDTLDLRRVDVQAKQNVRVTALLSDARKEACGGKMTLAELGLTAAFGDTGIAEISFTAPRSGQLRIKCAKDALQLTIKNPSDPDE
ncbi:MAG: copper resistance protein CopC [Chloroflexi bacterium]|nr:copper resistance protein CopC [Chloroflexota bacterium]